MKLRKNERKKSQVHVKGSNVDRENDVCSHSQEDHNMSVFGCLSCQSRVFYEISVKFINNYLF